MTLARLILRGSAVLGALAGLFCFVHAGAQAVEHLTLERAAPIYMNCPNLTYRGSSSQGPGWIALQSLRGISSPRDVSSGGSAYRESSRPSVSEIVITKRVDTASPAFLEAAQQGKRDKCEIHFDRTDTSNAQPYMTINLENVLVSNVRVSGHSPSSGGDRPTESITLNFTKIEYKNKVQTGTGGTITSGKNVLAPILLPSQSPGPSKPK